jgi:phosphoribosylformylglycinamidine synthase
LSEGGLTAAVAEMAFAGGCGASIELMSATEPAVALFSESNSRFACEIAPENAAKFEQVLAGVPLTKIGKVAGDDRLSISAGGKRLVDADIHTLKEAWQAPLRW